MWKTLMARLMPSKFTAEVRRAKDHYGPGYDLMFRITSQVVSGNKRAITGSPGMSFGGYYDEIKFVVPAHILRFNITQKLVDNRGVYFLMASGKQFQAEE